MRNVVGDGDATKECVCMKQRVDCIAREVYVENQNDLTRLRDC